MTVDQTSRARREVRVDTSTGVPAGAARRAARAWRRVSKGSGALCAPPAQRPVLPDPHSAAALLENWGPAAWIELWRHGGWLAPIQAAEYVSVR